MKRVQMLCDSYLTDEISLEDFQARLRPLLGDREERSTEDDAFINEIDNKIELVLYTTPENLQKDEAVKLIPLITEYVKSHRTP